MNLREEKENLIPLLKTVEPTLQKVTSKKRRRIPILS
jgi:hypothetical protein